MISRYVDKALERGTYELLEDGTFCATVRGLRGVIATGKSLEACRRELAEVVEEWVLVRVARGLSIPALGGSGFGSAGPASLHISFLDEVQRITHPRQDGNPSRPS